MKFITLPEAKELYTAALAELSNFDQDELRNRVDEIVVVAKGWKCNEASTKEIREFLKNFLESPVFLKLEPYQRFLSLTNIGSPECDREYFDIYNLIIAKAGFSDLSPDEEKEELESSFKNIFKFLAKAGLSQDEEIIKETRDLFDQILKSDAWRNLNTKTKYIVFAEVCREVDDINFKVCDLLAINGATEGLKIALDEDEVRTCLSMLVAASTSSNEDIKGAAVWHSQKFVESGAFLNPLGIHEKAEIAKAKWQSKTAQHVLEAIAEYQNDLQVPVDPRFHNFWTCVKEEKDFIYHALVLQEHLAKTTPNKVLRNTKLFCTLRKTRNLLNAVVPEI